ncbi:Translation machinery-associated protein 16 [Trypanosoma melophagium]|uniref:Translation machinery-associated protein 16 n=1 Tax=Trypanosoma melophagium TaxID=715481 RepID=UPI00351A4107|nr:Translation machinery-associated protein 16 [Trypanosoma melophagium]
MGGKKGRQAAKILVHPNSRKVKQLHRQSRRDERINKQEKKLHAQELLEAMRFFWFREQCLTLGRSRSAFAPEESQALTLIYLSRNDDEIASLKSLRNPPAGRIKTIEALKTSEFDAFHSSKGIVVPDIADEDTVEILTEIWDGRSDTVGVVPRCSLSFNSSLSTKVAEIMEQLKEKLEPIDKVREEARSVAPKKALKFQKQKRTQSVKKLEKFEEVALRSKTRAAARQQKRLKEARRAMVNSKRAG